MAVDLHWSDDCPFVGTSVKMTFSNTASNNKAEMCI